MMRKPAGFGLLILTFWALIPFRFVQAQPKIAARSLVSIDRAVVKLKDLFSVAGRQADIVLGPAPPPGSRIVVGDVQLMAISKRYGLDWSPGATGVSTVIERRGIQVTQHQMQRALGPALQQAGAPRHVAFIMSDVSLPMVPPNARPQISVNTISYHQLDGTFRAKILVAASGMNAASLTVTGLATPAEQAVVATHRLLPGQILRNRDYRLAWVPRESVPRDAITRLAEAAGMQVDRAIARGSVLNRQFIASPTIIARGATVRLTVDMPDLHVTTRGIALAAGVAGGIIPVVNPTSHEIVQAVVDAPDQAHVVPGSMPMQSRTSTPYFDLQGARP